MTPGQVVTFTFSNSFIKSNNLVTLDCWMQNMNPSDSAPLYEKRSQSAGSIGFTIKNPGPTNYASTVLVLQWMIFG